MAQVSAFLEQPPTLRGADGQHRLAHDSDDKTSHPATTLDLQTSGHRFGALREELLHFVALTRGEAKHPLVTIDDAAKVIALAEMLMRSAQRGVPVTVAEFPH